MISVNDVNNLQFRFSFALMCDAVKTTIAENTSSKRMKYTLENYDQELLKNIDTLTDQIQAIDAINCEIADQLSRTLRPLYVAYDFSEMSCVSVRITWTLIMQEDLNVWYKFDTTSWVKENVSSFLKFAFTQQPNHCYSTLKKARSTVEEAQVRWGKWHEDSVFISSLWGLPFGVVDQKLVFNVPAFGFNPRLISHFLPKNLDLSHLPAMAAVHTLRSALAVLPKCDGLVRQPLMADPFLPSVVNSSTGSFFIWLRNNKATLYLVQEDEIIQLTGKNAGITWVGSLIEKKKNYRQMAGKWEKWLVNGNFNFNQWESCQTMVNVLRRRILES